jgi:hypothetical protein
MQPHSISAMAVAWHIFGENYGEKIPRTAEVQIDWTDTERKHRSLFHYISDIKISRRDGRENITQLQVAVRTTDGTPCTLTITRKSDGQYKPGDEELVATHSVQHKAGLEEHYALSRRLIRGEHRNSWKYKGYKSSSAGEGYFILDCEVRVGNTDKFMTIPYKVSVKPKEHRYVKAVIKEEDEKKNKGSSIFNFGKNRK